MSSNLKVVCRVRPLNEQELQKNKKQTIKFISKTSLKLADRDEKFVFDIIFKPSATQEDIYTETGKEIVESSYFNLGVLQGFNGTIFAYGQTASGKTHTMFGYDFAQQEGKGVILRAVAQVFESIDQAPEKIEFRIKISIVELYMEKMRDLLNLQKSNLKIRQNPLKGIFLEDVTEIYVTNEDEIYQIIYEAHKNRSQNVTNMNKHSSRSHMMFIMTIYQIDQQELSAKTGQLNLIDLAGCEKITQTGVVGKALDEAKTINRSLSCLGLVINQIVDNKTHISYRDSKLTRLLQESLGGNSLTSLILAVSPSCQYEAETLSTLRFGMRAKNIINNPKINKEPTIAELQRIILTKDKIILTLEQRIIQFEQQIYSMNLPLPQTLEKNFEIEEDQSLEEKFKKFQEQQDEQLLSFMKINNIYNNPDIDFDSIENSQMKAMLSRGNLLQIEVESQPQSNTNEDPEKVKNNYNSNSKLKSVKIEQNLGEIIEQSETQYQNEQSKLSNDSDLGQDDLSQNIHLSTFERQSENDAYQNDFQQFEQVDTKFFQSLKAENRKYTLPHFIPSSLNKIVAQQDQCTQYDIVDIDYEEIQNMSSKRKQLIDNFQSFKRQQGKQIVNISNFATQHVRELKDNKFQQQLDRRRTDEPSNDYTKNYQSERVYPIKGEEISHYNPNFSSKQAKDLDFKLVSPDNKQQSRQEDIYNNDQDEKQNKEELDINHLKDFEMVQSQIQFENYEQQVSREIEPQDIPRSEVISEEDWDQMSQDSKLHRQIFENVKKGKEDLRNMSYQSNSQKNTSHKKQTITAQQKLLEEQEEKLEEQRKQVLYLTVKCNSIQQENDQILQRLSFTIRKNENHDDYKQKYEAKIQQIQQESQLLQTNLQNQYNKIKQKDEQLQQMTEQFQEFQESQQLNNQQQIYEYNDRQKEESLNQTKQFEIKIHLMQEEIDSKQALIENSQVQYQELYEKYMSNLQSNIPDFKTIQSQLENVIKQKEIKRFENKKFLFEQEIKAKTKQLLTTELEKDNFKQRYQELEAKYLKELKNLHLQDINIHASQHIQDNNTSLQIGISQAKIENQILTKKLQRKSDHIEELKQKLKQSVDKNTNLFQNLGSSSIQDGVSIDNFLSANVINSQNRIYNHKRIIKQIKGGLKSQSNIHEK